jgi:hypothetical protein
MSFAGTIERLNRAVQGQRGVPRDECRVSRRDLSELLMHFDRLDGEVRQLTEENQSQRAFINEARKRAAALDKELDDQVQGLRADDLVARLLWAEIGRRVRGIVEGL